MYSAIIFDLGGVLFTNGTKAFIAYLSERFSLPHEKVKDVMDGELGSQYRRGEIGRDEFWERALEKLAITANIDEIENEWIDRYELIHETKDILKRLAKHYNVYYLSDNVRERVEKINKKYDFLSWFDDGVFSHEVHARKPDPKVYQALLDKIHLNPKAAIFVDDKESSLPPAETLGVTTILFTSPEQLEKDLRSLGIQLS